MTARLSYCSGLKSLRAAVRYSPAGVVLIFSELDLTKATVPSVLSADNGKGATSTGSPLLLLSFLCKKNHRIQKTTIEEPRKESHKKISHKKIITIKLYLNTHLAMSRGWIFTDPLDNGLDS